MPKRKAKPSFAGGFLALPMALLHCPKFRLLSSSGVKLLIDIASQFNGKNNGDLSAAWKVMQAKGWKSSETLSNAKKELLSAGFIAETRKGRLPNLCSLYGITWQPLNPDKKLDIGPNGFPAGAWADQPKEDEKKRVDQFENRTRTDPYSFGNRTRKIPIASEIEVIEAKTTGLRVRKSNTFIEVAICS